MNGMAITILIIGVILFALYQLFRFARRQAEIGRQVRQRLGFTIVATVDPALLGRIAAIMSPKTGKAKLSRVFKRDQGSHVLYDCYVDHEKNSDGADHCSIIVGHDWQLPSLRLAPRIGGEGKGWNLLYRLTLLAIRQGGFEPVALDDQPEFAKKYVALSRVPQEVPIRIPREVWRDMAAFPDLLFIQAEADTVIFSTFETLSGNARGDFETTETARLTKMMETGRRLNSIFEGCRRGVTHESAVR